MACYDLQQRHFGENYAQELMTKSPQLPQDIQWHFIGHLQSNKAKKLVNTVTNLWIVETVHSLKLARLLSKAVTESERETKLNIFVQVNTSNEDQKSGIRPDQVVDIVREITSDNPDYNMISFQGLMTIGQYSGDPTADFQVLVDCKATLAQELDMPLDQIELSMGMSADYQQAAEMGSTNVRVGSTIFGARNTQ
eukprot:TRINITY_DN4658_c0_g1_i1.p1 TRINITY_DN4658_c0_g1~~TRINITY_DN4658_c0_g1_i1.p1  ORF type:complete len:195 (-),score=31.18 TRINITY_DN4658_c0_g1_i1:17-601(-)